MTKGWRVIDCTAMTGKLTYKRGQLIVEHHDLETRIPPSRHSRPASGCPDNGINRPTATVGCLRRGSSHMPVERNPNSRIATMEQTKHPFRRTTNRPTGNEHSREKSSMETDNTSENSRTIARTGHARIGRWTAPSKPSHTGALRRPEQHRGTGSTRILASYVPRRTLPSIPGTG